MYVHNTCMNIESLKMYMYVLIYIDVYIYSFKKSNQSVLKGL